MVDTHQDVSLARAGAVAEYVGDRVIFCGGRNGKGVHRDCLQFDPMRDIWGQHSEMSR